MARALQPLVVEGAVAALANHRRRRHLDRSVGPPRPQPGDDLRRVRDGALRQVAHLRAGVGQDFLALSVVELLGDVERLRGRPPETAAGKLLERRQVVQARRTLSLVLHAHPERTFELPRRLEHRLRLRALDDALLRRVAHPQRPAFGMRRRHHLEVPHRHEVADLDLAPARDRQRRRLHPADADHVPRAPAERHRRRSGQGQVVDLVRLPARDRGLVEPGVLGVGPGAPERRADGLRILRREQHPQHLAAITAVLEDFLADELPLAVAVGREPDALRRLQRRADGRELRRLVAAPRRLRAVQPLGPQQRRRPALPPRVDVLGLAQVEQMPFGRENGAVARTHRGAHVLRLARLLGDDDLADHDTPAGVPAPASPFDSTASMAAETCPGVVAKKVEHERGR